MNATRNTCLPLLAAAGPRRRGVSLLEVLISIFVMAVGLLGVAALIPVGRFTIVEAGKADRSGSCGRAALREIKVRNMLSPLPDGSAPNHSGWVDYKGSQVGSTTTSPAFDRFDSYCIDPILLARYPNTASVARFPNPAFPSPIIQSTQPTLRRVTFPWCFSTNSARIQAARSGNDPATRLFTWADDLVFDLPQDRTARPRLMLDAAPNTSSSVTTSIGWPPAAWETSSGAVSSSAVPLTRSIEGAYSWFVTLSPAVPETGLTVGLADRMLYNVSAVVCYKRNFEQPTVPGPLDPPPAERIALATLPVTGGAGGISGGDVTLEVPTSISRNPDYLNIPAESWIMLGGRVQARELRPTGSPTAISVYVYRWYKVVGGEETGWVNGSNLVRRVTLEGPDFPQLDTGYRHRAIIVDGVIGVYSTTTELDSSFQFRR